MASLWADVQLGMWDVQDGIPGKATSLREECCIDRKVWMGNSHCVCVAYITHIYVYIQIKKSKKNSPY